MKLIIASNNEHKLREIREILGAHFGEILSMREAGIEHETVEDGSTFMENALKKAREVTEISGCCALADDSGLCVDVVFMMFICRGCPLPARSHPYISSGRARSCPAL